MELERQVISLESAKKLKELGVKQESLFWWSVLDYKGQSKVIHESDCRHKRARQLYSAFTASELGEMLPQWQGNRQRMLTCVKDDCYKPKDGWWIGYSDEKLENEIAASARTLVEAMAKLLIHLISNGSAKGLE